MVSSDVQLEKFDSVCFLECFLKDVNKGFHKLLILL